jgi:uncharacterized membrane protein
VAIVGFKEAQEAGACSGSRVTRTPTAFDPLGTPPPSGKLVQSQVALATYVGPIPLPAMLKQFDEICPGEANRILRLAEDQARHRMALEKKVVESDIRRSWAGLGAGTLVSGMMITFGYSAIMAGYGVAGGTLATAAVVGLASVFVYGTNSQRKERIEKAKIMSGRK